jgi:hypothetical protein
LRGRGGVRAALLGPVAPPPPGVRPAPSSSFHGSRRSLRSEQRRVAGQTLPETSAAAQSAAPSAETRGGTCWAGRRPLAGALPAGRGCGC